MLKKILKNQRNEPLKEFYFSMEGKKLLAYTELFLEQLEEQVRNRTITDFNRDYRFQTRQYEFLFCFSRSTDGMVDLLVTEREDKFQVMAIYYDPGIDGFLTNEVYLYQDNQYLAYTMEEFSFFSNVLSKMRGVSEARIVDMQIPAHLLAAIEGKRLEHPTELLQEVKNFLLEKRSAFAPATYSNILHMIRTIEEAIPYMEGPIYAKEHRARANRLLHSLSDEILPVLSNYAFKDETDRIKLDNKLSEELNRFYLLALDVAEFGIGTPPSLQGGNSF